MTTNETEIEVEMPIELHEQIQKIADKDNITFEEEFVKLVQFALDNGYK